MNKGLAYCKSINITDDNGFAYSFGLFTKRDKMAMPLNLKRRTPKAVAKLVDPIYAINALHIGRQVDYSIYSTALG